LKADNILVEPTGVCKISDFGISKKADIHRGRAFTGMKGTVFWMAPEILSSGGKGYDVKVDIGVLDALCWKCGPEIGRGVVRNSCRS